MFDALELIDVQLLDKLVLCLIPNFSQFLSKLRLKMIPLCNDDRFFSQRRCDCFCLFSSNYSYAAEFLKIHKRRGNERVFCAHP